MMPEATLHLTKARKLLATAEQLLKHGFVEDGARDAYLAVYHAAQAYVVDCTGRAAKTHSGLHSQFAQLATHEPRIGEDMRAFLPKAYRLKAIADYEFGEDASIPLPRATAVAEAARLFVSLMAELLDA